MVDPAAGVEARLLAESLKLAALDPEVEKSLQARGKLVADMLSKLMNDEDFVKFANRVAQKFSETMHDPIVMREAQRFNKKMQEEVALMSSQEHQELGRRLFSPVAVAQARSPA